MKLYFSYCVYLIFDEIVMENIFVNLVYRFKERFFVFFMIFWSVCIEFFFYYLVSDEGEILYKYFRGL